MKISVDRLKDTLKTEYGITSLEQLEEMIQKSEGINLGIFTMPIKGEKDDEKEKTSNCKDETLCSGFSHVVFSH